MKHILIFVFSVLTLIQLNAANTVSDSLILQQRIEDGTTKIKEQSELNHRLFEQGCGNEMKFVINLSDRITDTIVKGSEHFITEAGLEQKLNDSLQNIYVKYGLETYLIFSNYFELKIQARIPNGTDSLDVKSLFNESTWYNENTNYQELDLKSKAIYEGISTKLASTLNTNIVILNIASWNVLYLEKQGRKFYTYTLGVNTADNTNPDNNTIEYYNNIGTIYTNSPNLRYAGDRNKYVVEVVNACSRSALQVHQRAQLLLSTTSSQLDELFGTFESSDFYALNVKERLHALRVYIRNSYNEPNANRVVGFVPNQMLNEFYDSLKLEVSVSGTSKAYLYHIVDKTNGDDLDELFKYFVTNFPYYYKNKASQYTDESTYEIINLSANSSEIGDCEIMQAVIGEHGTMYLKYRAIVDVETSVTRRQTTDNTSVAGIPSATSDDDYCLQHPEDCNAIDAPDWNEFPGNNVIDCYMPVLISYEGEDEDVTTTLQGSSSALVPAMYLYYVKNEADKQKMADDVASAVEISFQVLAVVGTDGAAAPLLLGGTRFPLVAIKTYRALNYASLGLMVTDWATDDPNIHALSQATSAIVTAVDATQIGYNVYRNWSTIKSSSKIFFTKKLTAARKIPKQAAVDFYNALRNCGTSINTLPAAAKKKVMKLYYYLRKERLLDDVAGLTHYFNSTKIRGMLDNAAAVSGSYIKKVGNKYKIGTKEVAKVNELDEVVINTDLIAPGTASLPDDATLVGAFEGVNYRQQSFATGQRLDDATDDLLVFKGQDGSVICLNGVNCFVKNTAVKTQEGYKAIQDLKIGDVVLSFNEESKVTEYKKVKQLFTKTINKLNRIIAGTDTILCTPEHKFFSVGKWVKASALGVGMMLQLGNGAEASVTSNSPFDTTATVYNFEVEDNHNYYVGKQEILVHNDCGSISDLVSANKLSQADVAEFTKDFAGNGDMLAKFKSGELEVDAWKVLRTSHANLAKDELSLLAFSKARKNVGLQRLGVTETMLKKVNGSTQSGFKEIMNDLISFGNKMDQNTTIQFDNLSSLMNKFADGNTQNSQAAQWIIQDLTTNVQDFTNKTWKFEVGVTNANGNTSYIDMRSLGSNPKSIEYKWLTAQTVSKEDFIAQFINRDLFDVSNTQLSQIEWRIKGQKLTKENVIGYMSSPEGRAAIDNLGIEKVQSFFTSQSAQINEGNFVQFLIDKFNQDNIYNGVFK